MLVSSPQSLAISPKWILAAGCAMNLLVEIWKNCHNGLPLVLVPFVLVKLM
jgi:hypothetical protein